MEKTGSLCLESSAVTDSIWAAHLMDNTEK